MFSLYKFYPAGFDSRKYWDDRYAQEHAAGKSSEEFKKQDFWPLLEQILKKEGRYLDAGCGIGGWIIFLKELGYDVEGIDESPRILRALTDYDPEIRVKVAPITKIPYEDDHFDGIISIGSLEYAENKVDAAIMEANRILKKGGYLFTEVPLANFLRRALYLPLKSFEKVIKRGLGRKPSFANYLFTKSDIVKQLEQSGFEIVKVQTHELPESNRHFGLYVDYPFLRGKTSYQLNLPGIILKHCFNIVSPWIASTGMVIVARKK